MANLDDMLAKLPAERQARIYDMANEMMNEYNIQQLYTQLAEYQNTTNPTSDLSLSNNELEFGIRQLKDYIKSLGGTVNIEFKVDFPTGQQINATI